MEDSLPYRHTKELLSSHILNNANQLIAHYRKNLTTPYPNELSPILCQPCWQGAFEACDSLPSHFESLTESEKINWASKNGLQPEYREALGHWHVSPWLASQLALKGEMVTEILALHIWGRTTSGQSIFLDTVIQEIAADNSAGPTLREGSHAQ